jgi:hypothetical protein
MTKELRSDTYTAEQLLTAFRVQDFDALLAEAHAFVIWLREDRRLRDLARARRDDVPNLALCISCDVTYPLGVRHRC